MKKNLALKGTLYILGYLLFSIIPLLIILFTSTSRGMDFWLELSIGMAYCGLAMVGLQFLLTARLGWLHEPYGSDLVYLFHHKISIVAFALIALHPIALFVFHFAWYKDLLNPATIQPRVILGLIGLALLAVMVLGAVYRKKLRIEYFFWRIVHGLTAIAIVVVSILHVILGGTFINQPLKTALWVVYGALWIFVLLWARVIKPILVASRPWEVSRVIPEHGNMTSLILKPLGNYALKFSPGQFAWVYIKTKPGMAQEHPFSITASAENPSELSFAIKDLGDFTATIKNIQPGQKVYVEGPYGSFSADRHPRSKSFMFIAGGAGITPALSHLRTFADRGEKRPLILVDANRELEMISFREELDTLQKKLNLKIVHVIEKPPADWKGEKGFINAAMLEKLLPEHHQADDLTIFVCGPVPMMNAAEKALLSLDVPEKAIISERFDLV